MNAEPDSIECAVDGCAGPRVRGRSHCRNHTSVPEPWQRTAPAAPASTGSVRHDSALVCPHCQVRGRVSSRAVKQKKGISGGKATGAVLTLGWSMLATGLSRKQKMTEMQCGNCGTTWYV